VNPLSRSEFQQVPRQGRVRDQVAKQFEVSQGYVHAAQKIKEADEGVFEEIAAGTLSIPEAQEKLGLKNRMKGQMSPAAPEVQSGRKRLRQDRLRLRSRAAIHITSNGTIIEAPYQNRPRRSAR
ncbi:MAG: hypothetical protein WBW84_14000, partial [Acidobacteriaceae bacterium]